MKRIPITLAVISCLVGREEGHAQLTVSSVSANIGIVRTLFPGYSFYEDHKYAVYPELQISGNFLTPPLRWSVYWGYWTDGVDRALPVADLVTYSYSSHLVGARFILLPQKLSSHWPIPIGIFAGAAHHFIVRRYVGGFGIDGKAGQDGSGDANTVEIGVIAEVGIFGPISARAEAQQYIPVGDTELARVQKNRRAYKVGLAYTF